MENRSQESGIAGSARLRSSIDVCKPRECMSRHRIDGCSPAGPCKQPKSSRPTFGPSTRIQKRLLMRWTLLASKRVGQPRSTEMSISDEKWGRKVRNFYHVFITVAWIRTAGLTLIQPRRSGKCMKTIGGSEWGSNPPVTGLPATRRF